MNPDNDVLRFESFVDVDADAVAEIFFRAEVFRIFKMLVGGFHVPCPVERDCLDVTVFFYHADNIPPLPKHLDAVRPEMQFAWLGLVIRLVFHIQHPAFSHGANHRLQELRPVRHFFQDDSFVQVCALAYCLHSVECVHKPLQVWGIVQRSLIADAIFVAVCGRARNGNAEHGAQCVLVVVECPQAKRLALIVDGGVLPQSSNLLERKPLVP